jgi:hypothetical protein
VQRELRAGDVGHDHVVGPQRGHEARAEVGQHVRARPVREAGQEVDSLCRARGLEPPRRIADGAEAAQRRALGQRQLEQQRRHPVGAAGRSRQLAGVDRDRHPEAEPVESFAAREQEVAQRAGHHRQHHVVHGAVEARPHLLDRGELEAAPVHAPLAPERAVQRRARRRVEVVAQRLPHRPGARAHRAHRGLRAARGVRQRARERERRGQPPGHVLCAELEPARRRPRPPAPRALELLARGRGEQRAEQARARHAVDHAVVDLQDQPEAPALEPFDEPRLPQRPRRVEPPRQDAPRQRLQLRLAAGRGQRGAPHVRGEREAGVVHPDRVAERRVRDAHPVVRQPRQPRLHVATQAGQRHGLCARRGPERGHAADVHRRPEPLELEERCVLRREPLMEGRHPLLPLAPG